jgi:tetratricopeptide (TPR) repeat protein
MLPPYRRTISVFVTTFLTLAMLGYVSAGSVHAQDKGVVAAANAFTQAQQAELTGDFERAAELFELADRIAPTPEALRSATRARMSAGQLASAAGHAEELLRRYPSDEVARTLAEQALTRARPELTRYVLECAEPCTVLADGLAVGLTALRTQLVYVTPGTHQLTVGFDGSLSRGLRLTGAAGETRTIKIARPAPTAQPVAAASEARPARVGDEQPARQASAERRGIAPAYFWTAASLSVVSGALTLWSGLDLLRARDDFASSAQPSRKAFEDGEQKDLRTNVLLGVTSTLVVGTVALAFLTDFKGTERAQPRAALHVDGQGARLTLKHAF